jgi:hypothetical protein
MGFGNAGPRKIGSHEIELLKLRLLQAAAHQIDTGQIGGPQLRLCQVRTEQIGAFKPDSLKIQIWMNGWPMI